MRVLRNTSSVTALRTLLVSSPRTLAPSVPGVLPAPTPTDGTVLVFRGIWHLGSRPLGSDSCGRTAVEAKNHRDGVRKGSIHVLALHATGRAAEPNNRQSETPAPHSRSSGPARRERRGDGLLPVAPALSSDRELCHVKTASVHMGISSDGPSEIHGRVFHFSVKGVGQVSVRYGACPDGPTKDTVAGKPIVPIWAYRRKETDMPGPSCTEDALEAFDEHSDADDKFRLIVFRAIEDHTITESEEVQIARASALALRKKGALHVAVERCHRGLTMARSYLWTGDATPKLERKDRELMAGIISLEERLRERDGSPLPAA